MTKPIITWQAAMAKSDHREMQQWMRALSGGKYRMDEVIARLKTASADTLGPIGQSKTLDNVFANGDQFYGYLARRLIGHDPDVLGMILEDYATVAAGYEMDKILPAIQCPVLLMQVDPNASSAMSDEEVARAMTLLNMDGILSFPG